MSRDNQTWRPAANADIEWTTEGVPRSRQFNDVYYSRDDGLAETRFVFLKGNNLPERWQHSGTARFTVGELGFGTGLNFLATWAAWRELPEPRPPLHYLAVERFPLGPADLKQALAPWTDLKDLADTLCEHWPLALQGPHRLQLERGAITLDLWWEEANAALSEWRGVKAWYLDGFAPACNDAMWRGELCTAIAQASAPDATFATFTAAGRVRRDLQAAGFSVEKGPGFGRKRERLLGKLTAPAVPPPPAQTPWHRSANAQQTTTECLVIGAGLAGATCAAALASRGLRVTVLDRGEIAGAGSGNRQGVLYTRLSPRHSALTDFALLSYSHACRFYRALFNDGTLANGNDGSLCGSLNLSDNEAELERMSQLLADIPELAQVVDPTQGSVLCGTTVHQSGYWLPQSGWLHPAAVCRQQLNHPLITVHEQCGVLQLEHRNGLWTACGPTGDLAQAPTAIIACGEGTRGFAGAQWLPLQSIRGQTTQVALPNRLNSVVCHTGYIAPAAEGSHCIGATFDIGDTDTDLRPQDNAHNLAALSKALPELARVLDTQDPAALPGRVGFRCASPDYLPLVGPLPDREAFLDTYGELRRNARRIIDQPAPCLPQLYITCGHGSRGLTSTPLAGELLASMICDETPPLPDALVRALSPARFLARDLARNRI